MKLFQKQIRRAKPKPFVPELLAKWHREAKELRLECTELQQRNDELTRSLKRIAGDWMQQREAIKFALVEVEYVAVRWPHARIQYKMITVANKLRAALEEEHNGNLPATDG